MRQRADDAAKAGTYKTAKSIDRVIHAVDASTAANLKACSAAMKYKINTSLPMNGNESAHKPRNLFLIAWSPDKSGQHDEEKSSSGDLYQSIDEKE